MTGQITFTGNLGPGNAVSALVFRDVKNFLIDFEHAVGIITYGSDFKTQSIQMSDTTDMSDTVVEGVSIALTITNV